METKMEKSKEFRVSNNDYEIKLKIKRNLMIMIKFALSILN